MGFVSYREDDLERAQDALYRVPIAQIVEDAERQATVGRFVREVDRLSTLIRSIDAENERPRAVVAELRKDLQRALDEYQKLEQWRERREESAESLRTGSTLGERISPQLRSILQSDPQQPTFDVEAVRNDARQYGSRRTYTTGSFKHTIGELTRCLRHCEQVIGELRREENALESHVSVLRQHILDVQVATERCRKYLEHLERDSAEYNRQLLLSRMESGGYLHESFREGFAKKD